MSSVFFCFSSSLSPLYPPLSVLCVFNLSWIQFPSLAAPGLLPHLSIINSALTQKTPSHSVSVVSYTAVSWPLTCEFHPSVVFPHAPWQCFLLSFPAHKAWTSAISFFRDQVAVVILLSLIIPAAADLSTHLPPCCPVCSISLNYTLHIFICLVALLIPPPLKYSYFYIILQERYSP